MDLEFNFFMPTKVYFGTDCIQKNCSEFARWGHRALIVTGRTSAKTSGALSDVMKVLAENNIVAQLFDQIEENPTIEAVERGGRAAREFSPHMVIAIGGGSPLDAAKAIAILAVNDIQAPELFQGNFANAPLPVIAVPLTAGTGSEVSPYSVLTDASQQTKRSIADAGIFPKVAFLDARYTQTQSRDLTVHTAIDSLSHAIEGYLSRRATPVSDCLAIEAIRHFSSVTEALRAGEFSLADREVLLYASLLSGMVIAQTATTAVHALGYSLTYFRNVPHGRANGLLLGEYLRFNEPVAPRKIKHLLEILQMTTVDEFKTLMTTLLSNDEIYSVEDMRQFALLASKAKNMVNNPRMPNMEDLEQILKASLSVAPR